MDHWFALRLPCTQTKDQLSIQHSQKAWVTDYNYKLQTFSEPYFSSLSTKRLYSKKS